MESRRAGGDSGEGSFKRRDSRGFGRPGSGRRRDFLAQGFLYARSRSDAPDNEEIVVKALQLSIEGLAIDKKLVVAQQRSDLGIGAHRCRDREIAARGKLDQTSGDVDG